MEYLWVYKHYFAIIGLWTIYPGAVPESLSVHIFISSSIICLLIKTTVVLIDNQFLFNLGIQTFAPDVVAPSVTPLLTLPPFSLW